MAIVQPVEISSRRLMKVPSRELPRKKGVNFYVKKNYVFFSRYTKDSDPSKSLVPPEFEAENFRDFPFPFVF